MLSVEFVCAQDTGLVIRTDELQMTGLHPGARVVRTEQLQMTGLHPSARVIRTEQLQMTGLGEIAIISDAAVARGLPELDSPQLHRLTYPVATFNFPCYELTRVVTDVADE